MTKGNGESNPKRRVRRRKATEQSGLSAWYTRLRVIQLLVAEAVLLTGLLVVFHEIPWWFFWPISLGLVLPVILTEPYFTAPRGALATGLAQVAAYFASDRSIGHTLWNALLVISLAVIASALIAMMRNEHSGQVFHWIATRLGRAIVLGSIVTVILLIQVTHSYPVHASAVTIVIVLVYGTLFLDWAKLTFITGALLPRSASITAVLAPNQLLVRSLGQFTIGSRIRVRSIAGSAEGHVAEDLASSEGSEYRIVLDSHWRTVTDGSRVTCTVEPLPDLHANPRAFVIAGSTENSLRVNPVDTLRIGDTLQLHDEEGPLLYQVSSLKLEDEVWSGSAALVPRARLVQVGAPGAGGMILARATLPKPFTPIYSAADLSVTLEDGFMRIGVLKGTSVPVGIRREWLSNHGHLAVLGMSGMGKTTTVAKMPSLIGGDDKFVILDETSEYRTRMSFDLSEVSKLDWDQSGVVVCEPGGEMPERCEEVIKAAMTAAQAEYQAGQEPKRRFILLEEAHGWLPEWNFSTKQNADAVNRACRYILQARKFNITFVMVSQRTAVISKSALSQCENYIILRTLDQTSLEYVEGVIGVELKKLVCELGRYEAVCVGPIFNSDAAIVVKLDPPIAAG